MATKTRTKAATAKAAYRAVAREAEKIKSDAPATLAAMAAGDVLRQGDIYVVCLDAEVPTTGPHPRQLAPGTTQGSRHVAGGDCDVLVVDERAATAALNRLVPATRGHAPFLGPLIRARGPVTIAHPEHGDRTLPGGACYLVTYQRTWADEVRRAQD